MQEKIIQFGPENTMLGIASLPDDVDTSRPAVFLLNSGLIHRVGPYRMGVDFARNLAEQGFIVFRFDLSNIGDSPVYKTPLSYEQRTISEISAAMDTLTKRFKVKDFISVGLCTGAMHSHIIAVSDNRVKAAIMLDAYAYPTMKFFYKRYAHKLLKIFHPSIFPKVYNKMFNKDQYIDKTSEMEGVYFWEMPPKRGIKKDLELLMSRGVDLLYIYTGGSQYYYNYNEQFRDVFKSIDFKNHLDVHLYGKMDHTFILQRDRDYVLSFMTDWIKDKYCNGSE